MLPWSRNRSRSKLHWLHIPASGYIASSLLVRVLLATLRSPGYPTTSWPNCALWGSRRTSGCSPIQSGLENAQERSEDRSKSIEKWYTEHTSIQGILMLWICDAHAITYASFPASLVHTRGIVHGPGNRKVLHCSRVLSDIFSLSVLCVASAGSWKWPSSEISLEEALGYSRVTRRHQVVRRVPRIE